jgi:hypothetical protein
VTALADHVAEPDEATLRTAYELGREAVSRDLTVLDLAIVHHEALSSALSELPSADGQAIANGGGAFFVESLSAFEMVRRGFREAHEAALLERQHAAILRQLSTFLADASIALDATASLEEMLQLVVEQARELLGARRCQASVVVGDENSQTIQAFSESEDGLAIDGKDRLDASLVGWDGRKLGTIEVYDKTSGTFGEVDAAVLVHLAQMASAGVERAQLYERERRARRHDAPG